MSVYPSKFWKCSYCEMWNSGTVTFCEGCKKRKPTNGSS